MNFPPFPSKTIEPRIVSAWRLSEFVEIAVTLLIALVMLWIFADKQWLWRFVFVGVSILIGVQLCNLLILKRKQRNWRYELWDKDLEISEGVIFKKRTLIPFCSIQFVDTTQGPLERMFSLVSIRVSTAAKEHRLPGLSSETASTIRTQIIEKAELTNVD